MSDMLGTRDQGSGLPDISADDFRSRARARLNAAPSEAVFDPRTGRSWGRSDFDLNPELITDLANMPPPRQAAVLVPVVRRDVLTVLFTKRSSALRRHAGQISFPGGRSDDDDASPLATALREANEEIGLDAGLVEPLGYLDGYRTVTGYNIVPVVALVDGAIEPRPDPSEVAEVFEVPLSFLMEPANHQRHARDWDGRARYYYAMPYREHYIWGATAGMLKNLYESLFAT